MIYTSATGPSPGAERRQTRVPAIPISQGAGLYAVFGYNLLVISAVLAIRVLSAQARWRRGPKDGSGWQRADR